MMNSTSRVAGIIRTALLYSTILGATAGSSAAHAQDSGQAAVTDAMIADIIVQARRMAENQQDVPIAISTVTPERLEDATVSSTADIQRLVPSLQVTQNSSGYQDFIIRGSPAGFGNDPAVVTYVDEVPIEPRALVYSLFDLSSVQQLKGPQGTLFGRNSTGGAVLFLSHKPDLGAFNGYVSGRYGNLDEKRIEGAVNIPLGQTLAFRAAGQLQRRDPQVRSVTAPGVTYGNRRNEAIRLSSLWKPNDTFEIYTQFTHYNQRQTHLPQIIDTLAGPCTGFVAPAPVCAYQAPFNAFVGSADLRALFNQQQGLPSDRTINNHPNIDNAKRTALTNSVTIDLGAVSVRNIAYLGKTDIRFTKDFDGTPVRIFDSTDRLVTHTFYNETQFFGALWDERFNWRVGGVYSNDRPHEIQQTFVFGFPLVPSLTQPRNADADQKFKSYALFGQVTVEPVSDVRLTAGVRHTWDNRRLQFRIFQGSPIQVCGQQILPVPVSGAVPFSNTDLATCTRNLKLKFDDTNYNLSIDWKPTERILLYATTRRGYKAGSFNLLSTRDDLTTYDPEVAEDIELGVKTDFRIGNVPFRMNLAAFRTNYTNFQSSTVLVDPSTGNINVLTLNREPTTGQANKARIKGVEIEATVSPASWLQFTAFFSTIEAKYTRFLVPAPVSGLPPTADLSGTDIARVIPRTFGLTGSVDIPLGGGLAERLTGNVSFYTTAKPLISPLVPSVDPKREALDARISLRNLLDSGADFALFGKNLTDFNKCTVNASVTGAATCLYGEPRTYGVELTFRFGGKQ